MVVAFSEKLSAYGVLVDTLEELMEIAGHDPVDFEFEIRWANIEQWENEKENE